MSTREFFGTLSMFGLVVALGYTVIMVYPWNIKGDLKIHTASVSTQLR